MSSNRFSWDGPADIVEKPPKKELPIVHLKYNPAEPRDQIGQWTDGGGTTGEALGDSSKVSPERLKQVNYLLGAAGDYGAARSAVMDSMNKDEVAAFLEDYIKHGALGQPQYSSPMYGKYKDALAQVQAKYPNIPYDKFPIGVSPADLEHIAQFMERNPVLSLASTDLATRAGPRAVLDLVNKFAPGFDAQMPANGKVVRDEYGPEYQFENKPPEGLVRLSITLANGVPRPQLVYSTRPGGISGADYDTLANSIKPSTAVVLGVGMFSKDRDAHMVSFWRSWAMSGSSDAQAQALMALRTFRQSDKSLWTMNNFAQGPASENLKAHLIQTYNETQAFLTAKANKGKKVPVDTSENPVKLFRGIGTKSNSYVPGVVESWSTDLATGKRFAKQMGNRANPPTLLTTTVKQRDVFATYDSLKGWFPDEKNLKGKKEHVIFGASLNDITASREF